MNLQSFFKILEQPNIFQDSPVFFFTGNEYPVLFFSLLKTYFSKFFSGQLRTIDLALYELENFKGELSIPFLGNSLLYWCGNISELDAKNKNQFLTFALQYQGPHSLLFFADLKERLGKQEDALKKIELPQEVSMQEWQEIAQFFFQEKKNNFGMLQKMYKGINKPLSLDMVCLLAHYSSLIGNTSLQKFMHEWLDALIVPEKSLFSLSTYFFSKKAKSFFTVWNDIKSEYPAQFWISYWSEQLFRATCFVKLAHAQKFLEAKKVAFRLPFNLIKTDWRSLSYQELAQAHHFLYEIDYRLKNGSDESCLDLFYFNFFK